MSRPSEKMKTLAKQLCGDESEPKDFSSISLIEGLNFYSKNSDSKSSKVWSLDYLEKTNAAQAKRLAGAKDYLFGNRGFICRMMSRGYVADEQTVKQLNEFFESIKLKRDVESDVIVKEKPKAEPVKQVNRFPVNESIVSLDAAVDNAIMGLPPIPLSFSTTKKSELEDLIKHCEHDLSDIKTNRDAYTDKIVKLIVPIIKSAIVEAQKLIDHINKSKTKLSDSAAKNVPPSIMVKDVRFLKEEPSLKLKSIALTSVVGSKKCYVYDVEKRRLILYVSSDSQGLMFSGTTIKNYNPEKSEGKTIRKPEIFFSSFKDGISMSAINTSYNAIIGKATPVTTGRTNESQIFLKASN